MLVLLAVLGSLAVVAVIAGVPAASLTPLLFVLTALAWVSFLALAQAAWIRPRIGALTERAVIALIIALLGSVSSLIVANNDHGHPLFDAATASLLFRMSILAVLFVPAVWLALWIAGRLGVDP